MTHAPATTPGSSPGGSPGTTAAPRPGFLERNHFLLRRLHSLTGIMPVGVFVIFHLFTNFQMLFGTFDHEVGWIHSLPALLFLEIFGLWLPIAFHAVLGVIYIFSGRWSSPTYQYGGAWRYTLQRWTAWISLFFILFHVATLRWGFTFGDALGTPFIFVESETAAMLGVDADGLSFASTAMALDKWWVLALYVIGVYAVIYHWANGLWTAAITWGLTLSVASMRKWGYFCAAMGVVLSIFAGGAIYAAAVYEPTPEQVEAINTYLQYLESDRNPVRQ